MAALLRAPTGGGRAGRLSIAAVPERGATLVRYWWMCLHSAPGKQCVLRTISKPQSPTHTHARAHFIQLGDESPDVDPAQLKGMWGAIQVGGRLPLRTNSCIMR